MENFGVAKGDIFNSFHLSCQFPFIEEIEPSPLGGRWIQKMSKSGHFLKTDEGK